MTSIVLAGGKGMRLGRNKLSEVVGGQSLLQRVIDSLSQLSQHILVVTAQGQNRPILQATQARVNFLTDIYPGKGALGGIYAGLAASGSQHNLVLAADMPFLNVDLLSYLVEISPGSDVIMPRLNDEIEPLHAVYSRDCLSVIRQQIERNELQIRVFLGQVKVRYVEESEIDSFDPKHLSFFNVNTPNDLAKARKVASEIAHA